MRDISIKTVLGLSFLLFTACGQSSIPTASLDMGNILYVFDGKSNVIFAYDLLEEEFLSSVQFANPEKYRSSAFDVSSSGKIYVAIYGIPGAFYTPSSELKVFSASTLEEESSLKLDLHPEYFEVGENDTLYMAHGYEFLNEEGWAISIYEQDDDPVQEILKVAGAPQPPQILSDGKVYFSYFGAGDRHYGDSNILVYDPTNKDSQLLFPDNFTYTTPKDLFWDGASYYAFFKGIAQETAPYFIKPESNDLVEADKSLLIFSNINEGFERIDLEIPGSDMEIIIDEQTAYIYYCDSVSAKSSGLVIVDLITKEVLENYDLGGGSFSEDILFIGEKLYITNRAEARLDVFNTNTKEFTTIEMPEGLIADDIAVL